MSDNVQNYHESILEWVESEAGNNADTVAIGKAFCEWCLTNIFGLTADDAIDAQEQAGARDYGIDAIFERDSETIVLQSKYESSHSIAEAIRFHYDMSRITKGRKQKFEANPNALRAIARILDSPVVHFY
jgi:hypothetical protein